MSSVDSDGRGISRRGLMALFGGAGITGLAPNTGAHQSLPERVRAQREIDWAAASTTTAAGFGYGEVPASKIRDHDHEDLKGGYPVLKPVPDVSPHDERDVAWSQIELLTNVLLTNVMWLPWLGQWRYTFQIIGAAGGKVGGGPVSNIGGHAATVWQPNVEGRYDNEVTLVTSQAGGDTPHAVGYPDDGKETIDDEWSASIGDFRIDQDDLNFGLKLTKTVAYEAANTFGGIVSKIDAANSLKNDAMDAYYDEEWRNKVNPNYPERDFTSWYYDDPQQTVSHRRVVEVDVKPAEEAAYPDALVDVRSEAVNEHIMTQHQEDSGIRNYHDSHNDQPMTSKHVGRSIASNGLRLRLPTLPSPERLSRDEFDEQTDATLKPYCYVDESGEVVEDDCLYLATGLRPDAQWY